MRPRTPAQIRPNPTNTSLPAATPARHPSSAMVQVVSSVMAGMAVLDAAPKQASAKTRKLITPGMAILPQVPELCGRLHFAFPLDFNPKLELLVAGSSNI